jgi:hypothetical protein
VHSDYYYHYFEFLHKELGIKLDEKTNTLFQDIFRLQRESGVYSAIFSEALCVVSKYPKKVHRNNALDLHNTAGPAVEWGAHSPQTNFDGHYINGRSVPKKLFEGFSKEEFLSEQNEDTRAAMFELVEARGEGSMLTFLGAESFNKETVVHANGDLEELEIYQTKEKFKECRDLSGKSNVPLAWLKLTCPSTGSTYLISTDPSFKTASEAAKFHRPDNIPFSLEYSWNSRN